MIFLSYISSLFFFQVVFICVMYLIKRSFFNVSKFFFFIFYLFFFFKMLLVCFKESNEKSLMIYFKVSHRSWGQFIFLSSDSLFLITLLLIGFSYDISNKCDVLFSTLVLFYFYLEYSLFSFLSGRPFYFGLLADNF